MLLTSGTRIGAYPILGRAFEWLERGRERRDTPSWLARHPLLCSLHADPRRRPFLNSMGLE